MIIITAISIAIIGISTSVYLSRRRFKNSIDQIQDYDYSSDFAENDDLQQELDRIEQLQKNIKEIKDNITYLNIPTPEEVSDYDNSKSSLNKISIFFEEHSLATVGTEHFILSILPTSQVGQSLHALSDVLPSNLGNAVFGDAFHSIKDSVISLPQEGLSRFIEGIGHLGPVQMASIVNSLEHHQVSSALLTPLKSGIMEAIGIHDATKDIASSICDISDNAVSALEVSTSISELTDASNLDFTGHIPIATLAISSFREFQLLNNDKTDYISSIKNIALDAAGAGVGGLAGAKGGAIVGGFFGPLGAVIGGAIGGIAGAIGGRYATNKVKRIPLNNAIEDYQSAYNNMKDDTDNQSKNTLSDIKEYADYKSRDFKNAKLLNEVPTIDTDSVVLQISLALYKFILNEVYEMRSVLENIKRSFWYSEKKYGEIIENYKLQLDGIESQLPTPEKIQYNPEILIETLINIHLPNRKSNILLQKKINECSKELKSVNDKNDSNILLWSYMINNLYQQTLNDIADFSNKKMKELNTKFEDWRKLLLSLEKNVEREKAKLGY